MSIDANSSNKDVSNLLDAVQKQLEAQSAQLQREITERKQAIEVLRLSEEKYRLLVENLNDVVFSIDTQGCFTYISPSVERFATYKVSEIMGQPFARFVHPDDLPGLQESFKRTLDGELEPYEFRVLTKEGAVIHVLTSSRPLLDDSRQLVGLTGTMTNVSARKEAEEALREAYDELEQRVAERTTALAEANASLKAEIAERERVEDALRASEERYRAFYQDNPSMLFTLDAEGYIISVNEFGASQMGYTVDELEGRSVLELYHNSDRLAAADQLKICVQNPWQVSHWQLRKTRKDGSPMWADEFVRAVVDPEGKLSLLAVCQDITERRWADGVREALYKISRAAISADDLEHLYSLIHGILGELMPVDNFFIALYDPSEDMFSYPYYVDQFDAPPAPEKPGRGLTGYVLRSGHMLLATPQVFDALVEQGEVESVGAPSIDWLGVPLRVEDKIIGVMAAQSYQESVRFGEKEMSIMVFVSTQVAMAIDRKRSEEALRRKLDELTILHGVAVAGVETASEDYLIERTTEIIGSKLFTDNFGVLLLDEASGCLCPHPSYHGLDPGPGKRNIPLGQGITGSVAKTGRSWRVPDASCEPAFMTIDPSMRSELCVPLKVSGRVIGVINAESVRRDAFTETDERLLETVAGQLATTIEKLRLFEKTKCHLERINALHEIDVTLTSSFDLRLTLRVLLQQVVTQLGVDAADVLLLNWRTQTLEYAAGLGFRAAPYPGAYIQMSDGPGGRVILERAPLYITDLNASRDDLSLAMHLVNEGFTAYYGSPLISKGQVKGVLEIFHRRSFTPGQEWLNFLEALATQAAIAVDNASMFDALQRSSQELTVAYDATLEGWAHALELRDRETEGHSQRVTDLTVRLARVMGINDADLVHVRRGALLHDIGKMGVPDSILFKSSDLSEEEWEIMHKHPIYAFEMLHPIPYLRPALDIPYCHHEKWDGSGYPRHLGGEKIPLAARVFAVVDVCDALVSDRPYRKAWTEEDALEYVKSEAGKYFDPQVVSAFINILKERRN